MTQESKPIPHVYLAMEQMTELLAKVGISKDKKNTDQKYNFRGIDDIRNAIAPYQKECNLLIYPTMTAREQFERTTKSGGFALQVIVKVDMHFVSTKDGSEIISQWENEAVDYSDKATNKAVSQCYKTACVNTFNIPTEGEEDVDGEKKELKAKKVGVFESPELRSAYIDNCIDAFNKSETVLRLKDAESLYHDRLVLMKHSDDPEDRAGHSKIAEIYTTKMAGFAPAKGKVTVESAVAKGAA